MNFFEIKEILAKIEFLIRVGNLDIEACSVDDIPREQAEKELKKMYVALRVWMMRLSTATNMDFDQIPEIIPDAENIETAVQLPLFDLDDLL